MGDLHYAMDGMGIAHNGWKEDRRDAGGEVS